MAITENFDIYYDSDNGLAVEAQYTSKKYGHPSTRSIDVSGLFDNDFLAVEGVATTAPMFECATEKLPDIARGDKITIPKVGGTTYTIINFQPDGTGSTELILEKD